MKLKDIKKGDWIINTKIPESTPWWVCYKYTGMTVIRRKPKIGKLTVITTRQLCNFKKIDYIKYLAEEFCKNG